MHILTYIHTQSILYTPVIDVNSYHPMWKVRTGLQRRVQTDASELCMCSWWAGHKPVLIWNPCSSISTVLSTSSGKLPLSNAFSSSRAPCKVRANVSGHLVTQAEHSLSCFHLYVPQGYVQIFFSFTSHCMYWKTFWICTYIAITCSCSAFKSSPVNLHRVKLCLQRAKHWQQGDVHA